MPTVLKSKFSHRFDAAVWEIRALENFILINTRDNQLLSSKFSLFDLQSNRLKWENLQFEDDWWVSAYHMTEEMVVFQKFEDSQNIDDRSVFGFDIQQKDSVWSMENVKLTGARGNQLFLVWENDDQLIFNIQTQEWDVEPIEHSEVDSIKFPVHYEEDNQHFDTLARFLKSKVSIDLKGSCDYLESNGLIIMAANHVIDGRKSLTLYVFSESGELLLENELEHQMKGLVSGAFFIVKDALIFVTGKNELKIYRIDEKD